MSKGALVIMVVLAVLLVGGATAVIIGSRNNDQDTSATETTSSQPDEGSAEHMNMPAQSPQNQGSGATDDTAAAAQATDKVTISEFAFGPKAITVKAGTTVTWTNNDSVEHDVVADDGSAGGPKSEMLAKGESYSFTFQKAGTYDYHCTPHPYMKGTVIVTE